MKVAGALVAVALFAAATFARPGHGDAPPACRSTQLRTAPTFYGEAGGEFTETFTFVNRSPRACLLRGWPRVRPEGNAGRSLRVVQGSPRKRPFRTVVLAPRHAASFDIYGADWNHLADKPCPTAHAVRIWPPPMGTAISVTVKIPNCGRLYVAPVIAGTRDREAWSIVWRP